MGVGVGVFVLVVAFLTLVPLCLYLYSTPSCGLAEEWCLNKPFCSIFCFLLAGAIVFMAVALPQRAPAPGEEGGAPADDSGVVFLPTVAQAILENLSREIPSHTLLMMDFDHLPDVRVAGRNAPLVSNTVASVAQDASTYLVPPGSQ